MLDSLGYAGVSAEVTYWLQNLSPIAVFIGGIALMLTLVGFGLALFGIRSSSGTDGGSSGPSGLDTRLR